MHHNPLLQLESLGQSIWLDYIKRDMLNNGELKKFIQEDGLQGMTSNPDIFEKAITGGHDYDDAIKKLTDAGKSAVDIYDALTQQDVQTAADQFRSVYDATKGADGYVSLEVNPHLAHDAQGTIEEAHRLWKAVDKPNVLIKVPGTQAGLHAIKQLISDGISVNVTLLFGLDRYHAVANAYIAGIEERIKQNKPVQHIASVASFFLSRIDVLVDPLLEKIINANNAQSVDAKKLHGQVAIASAKMAYQIYKSIFHHEHFRACLEKGAKTQRVLWASTSTKNPHYSDVKYVESLIGPETVNTVPMETLLAYRDHGEPQLRLERDTLEAADTFKLLSSMNIDINQITQQLEDEGVQKFNKAYDKLIDALKIQMGKN